MAFYENTIITRQDLADKELKSIKDKYNELINKSSGKVIKIEEWGLINQSVPSDQLDEAVDRLASDLANLAPGTMQFGLEAYVNQDAMNFDEALPYLGKKSAETFAGPDAQEGIAAFLEKREPKWD